VTLIAPAPGKVNLCLFLGPVRSDGRHELVTLFESVSLADLIAVTPAPAAATDQVVCPGVDRLNIVKQTLDGLRARGWGAPPVRVVIDKRIPLAGGMGGGSADAAAMLRVAAMLAPVMGDVGELAVSLGADVPSQLTPGVSIGTGAGDVVELVFEPLERHAFVIVPQAFGLSTADVYREADRLGLPRDADDLTGRLQELRAAIGRGAVLSPELLVNDLEPAALSLRPEIGRALDAVRDAGAVSPMVSGSGPTVFGLLTGPDAPARAAAVAVDLAERYPGATSAAPVSEEFWASRGS
jgi:4-diphosphocytidyl-2-C-methyl-D-erythritol kinase